MLVLHLNDDYVYPIGPCGSLGLDGDPFAFHPTLDKVVNDRLFQGCDSLLGLLFIPLVLRVDLDLDLKNVWARSLKPWVSSLLLGSGTTSRASVLSSSGAGDSSGMGSSSGLSGKSEGKPWFSWGADSATTDSATSRRGSSGRPFPVDPHRSDSPTSTRSRIGGPHTPRSQP